MLKIEQLQSKLLTVHDNNVINLEKLQIEKQSLNQRELLVAKQESEMQSLITENERVLYTY